MQHNLVVAYGLLMLPLNCSVAGFHGLGPDEVLHYAIRHQEHGPIGTHRLTFRRERSEIVIESRSEISMPILFWERHYEIEHREVWRGERMISYYRSSNSYKPGSNGRSVVTAWADGDNLVINGPSGRTTGPATVMPAHPWNIEIVSRDLLMDTRTGELKRVRIEPAGETNRMISNRWFKVRIYRMSGDMEGEMWFAPSGICLWMQVNLDGHAVSLVLSEPGSETGSADPPVVLMKSGEP